MPILPAPKHPYSCQFYRRSSAHELETTCIEILSQHRTGEQLVIANLQADVNGRWYMGPVALFRHLDVADVTYVLACMKVLNK